MSRSLHVGAVLLTAFVAVDFRRILTWSQGFTMLGVA
jgi:hypothetical protein